jgi:hypothetical protein
MHARITRFDVRVEDIEKLNRYFTETVIPKCSALPGYKGAACFADRTNGSWQSITYWDNEATMLASEQAATQLRDNARRDFKTGKMTVELCTVETDRREPTLDQASTARQTARTTERTHY